jgi:putative ABC transport system permease protein
LKPGVSMGQAGAYFRSISPGIFAASLPVDYPPVSVKPYLAMKLLTTSASGGISRLREEYSAPLGLLMAIAGFVLLIACANLANLMLARASARQREIAVRLALGASRARLVQQLLTEGLLLAVAGAGFGLILAQGLSRFLISFLTTAEDPLLVDLHLDWRVFGFTAILAIFTCILFALTPAIRAVGVGVGSALKSGSRGMTSGREPLALRRMLAASQIALSLALLVSALLFVTSLRNLATLDPGFQARGVLIADIDFGGVHLPAGRAFSFRREILERVRAIPGVESAAEATVIPVNGANWNNRMWMDGEKSGEGRVALRSMVGAGYFRTLKMPLIAGREIDDRDLASFSSVAVVNEEFARAFSGVRNAVGRRFWIEATPYYPETAYEIIGVAKNAKYHDMREDFQPVAFTALTKEALSQPGGRFVIRSSVRPDALAASMRSAVAGISPEIQYSFHFLERWIQESLLRERLMATLSGMFGALAVLLAAFGLYGVISYTVAWRTSEIGIRIALGADRAAVIWLILRETAFVLAFGLCAGFVLSLAAGRFAAIFLFGVNPQDPFLFAAAGISISVMAVAASYLPTLRACAVNPVIALRQE